MRPYNVALFLFLLANVVIILAIINVLKYFDLLMAVNVGWVFLTITAFVLLLNFSAMISSFFLRIRTRQQIMDIKKRVLLKRSNGQKENSDEQKN